jgi:hypothetical protein
VSALAAAVLDALPEEGLSNTLAAAFAARLPVPRFIVKSPLTEKSTACCRCEKRTISEAKMEHCFTLATFRFSSALPQFFGLFVDAVHGYGIAESKTHDQTPVLVCKLLIVPLEKIWTRRG